MVAVIFTLDYELHGNGEGCAGALMVEPTDRLLCLFDQYGAKLTIMADVAEILKFREYAATHGRDDYQYTRIVTQLQRAVRGGHDVQLHLHSSYFNATHDGHCWRQDWSEYDFAGLRPDRLHAVIKRGKDFLESILQPVKTDYICSIFRAANWSVSPSANVIRALVSNGIRIDTSVFKYGRRNGLVNFDYADAPDEMALWRADDQALWRHDANGKIWEVPIYSEHRCIFAFLSPSRIYRVLLGRFHRVPDSLPSAPAVARPPSAKPSSRLQRLIRLFDQQAWKADFNQCTGRQLIQALKRGAERHRQVNGPVPFVLIGHSKLFTGWNERSLRHFLAYVAENRSHYAFGTFDALGLPALAQTAPAATP